MSTSYCPKCESLTDTSAEQCPECTSARPVEGWPSDTLIGAVFASDYMIQTRLGSGGFGVVYLAENTELGGRRALKVLHARHVHNDAILKRFKREAKALYRLQSPYTVRMERWGRSDEGHHYLVMEFAEGESLRELLSREGPLPQDRAWEITRQIAIALSDAHDLNIVHRDLKPDNIVVRSHRHVGERIAVLDFGISKILSDETSKQRSGLVGTPAYMAPELWKPSLGEANIRADLWSLGLILFEMVNGKLPFDADTSSEPMGMAYQALNLDAARLKALLSDGDLSDRTRELLGQLLVPNPDDRLQTPGAVLDLMAGGQTAQTAKRKPQESKREIETADTIPVPERQPSGRRSSGSLMRFDEEPPETWGIDTDEQDDDGPKPDPGGRLGVLVLALFILGGLALGTQYLDEAFWAEDAPDIATDTGPDVDQQPEPLAESIVGSDGIVAHLVAEGSFLMGKEGVAEPVHSVTVGPIYVDENPVTVAQWQACVDAEVCSYESQGCAWQHEGDHPVTCAPWPAAETYCRWTGRRLLSEAEWEYAATREQPIIVVAELGEWVADWYSADYYEVSPPSNPQGSVFGFEKVIRGLPDDDGLVVLARRDRFLPQTRSQSATFRCGFSP